MNLYVNSIESIGNYIDYVNYLETTKWGISGGVHFLNISLIESSWAWGLKGNIVSPNRLKEILILCKSKLQLGNL
jgi:hypothetical protein